MMSYRLILQRQARSGQPRLEDEVVARWQENEMGLPVSLSSSLLIIRGQPLHLSNQVEDVMWLERHYLRLVREGLTIWELSFYAYPGHVDYLVKRVR